MKNLKYKTIIMGVAGLLGTLGCQDTTRPEARGLKIDVTPLTLPGITEATYTLTVKNGLGQVVWSEGPLASTRFGNGSGALTYIGPCDAQENPHSVELVLNSLTNSEGPMTSPEDYVNPTIDTLGVVHPIIRQPITCVENSDVLVAFDLTIMRSAKQGFFDFAINFEDIFCSAKIDCSPALLHDGDGDRGPTAVFGFACTGGDGDPTHLYLSELELSCTGGVGGSTVTTIPVSSATPGQQGPLSPGIFQWAVYQGQEFLDANFDKCFWNLAIGLDTAALTGQTCTLSAVGTASQEPLPTNIAGEFQIPTTGAYPVIRWDVDVLTNGTLCQNNGLDLVGSHVKTDYVYPDTVLAEIAPLEGVMNCGERAGCTVETGVGAVVSAATADGFTLTLSDGSIAPGTFALPAGYTLADSCCAPACCQ